ncbi:MAG: cellulose synthase [Spirochaetae bacterium HGW-Spirochaetae-3]|jgi:cellulose synthase (UDP-forming)|nr:MAG: cellulose synthase [Spirochaetae bacterium HGW-Spirochaetae-3]
MSVTARRRIFRIISVLTIGAGYQYLVWRYAFSLNLDALWLSIPFVLAETYGILDMTLFLLMMWKRRERVSLPPPSEASVDVFITTYNEDPALVERTAAAACAIRWPDKRVFILDDGSRPGIEKMAERLGCGYIARGADWTGKPRHAKAGNVNNALVQTTGDFILILDADQIPSPRILERTLGYFDDPLCAFVQTPQFFYNIPPGDPFGTDAPLFYGPILQGKDGWNAAFFCGSNAVLRRDALMRLGVTAYAKEVEGSLRRGLKAIRKGILGLPLEGVEREAVKTELLKRLGEVRRSLKRGQLPGTASDEILEAIKEAGEALAAYDLADIGSTLQSLAGEGDEAAGMAYSALRADGNALAGYLARLGSVGISPQEIGGIDLTRGGEAIPVQALDTGSITEDMATALRLHALGYRSVYHNEILAQGLAPEDLGTSLKQRLRWAQGTIQVLFKENPLTLPGLTVPQRLMYFATIFSYFSGFFNLLLVGAPILWFFTGISPVAAWNMDLFYHLAPFLILNRVAFMLVARGFAVWRSEQYNLALFPLWIKAVISVLSKKPPTFVVTDKQRQQGTYLRLVWPQVAMIAATVFGIAFAGFSLVSGNSNYQVIGLVINSFWGVYNCVLLSSVVRAAVYQPPSGWSPRLRIFE